MSGSAPARLGGYKKIATFYALTLAFSSVFYALILNAGNLRGSEMLYVTGLMWSPALAGWLTQKRYGQTVRGFGWTLGKPRYQWWAYLLPLAYALPVYLLVWVSDLGGFDLAGFTSKKAADFGWSGLPPALVLGAYVLLAGTAGVLLFAARTLGEEIGWRGFLVPELYKVTGFHGTALTSGLMWAAWHYPILVFGDYNSGAPAWYGLTCFTVMVVGLSYVFAWLRLASGNLWTATLIHASHNRYIQTVLTPLTATTSATPYLVDEFGAGMALTSVVTALLVCRHVAKHPLPSSGPRDAATGPD